MHYHKLMSLNEKNSRKFEKRLSRYLRLQANYKPIACTIFYLLPPPVPDSELPKNRIQKQKKVNRRYGRDVKVV